MKQCGVVMLPRNYNKLGPKILKGLSKMAVVRLARTYNAILRTEYVRVQ